MKNIWSQYNHTLFILRNSPRPLFLYPAAFCFTRNGIPSCFLFRGMVRNGIPRVCLNFCSTERNSELFSLPQKGLERNSESMLLFLFRGTEFQVVFSSAEGFGTEFQDVSVPRNSQNSVGNNHLFRKFPTLNTARRSIYKYCAFGLEKFNKCETTVRDKTWTAKEGPVRIQYKCLIWNLIHSQSK